MIKKRKGQCCFVDKKSKKVNRVSRARSKVSRRTKDYQNVNLQNKIFEFCIDGSCFKIKAKKISTSALRTIDKYQGIVNFLINYKGKSTFFLDSQRKVINLLKK